MIALFVSLMIFILIYSSACEAAIVLTYIGHWKTYKKAGFEGWECLIPFYNSFVLYKSVWGSGWFFLLGLIPVGGTIARMITYYQLGKRFGKSTGFCVGLLLLPWLFIFILGIEKAKMVKRNVQFEDGSYGTVDEIKEPAVYQGPGKNGKLAMILSSSIVGFFSIIITMVTAVAIVAAIAGIFGNIFDSIGNDYNDGYQYESDDYDDWDDSDNWNDSDDWDDDEWSNDDWDKFWNSIDWDDPNADEQIEDILDDLL